MFKILLIEDEAEKRRRIAASISSIPGLSHENVDIIDNVFDAKRRLLSRYYNLVILDINLPPRSDQPSKTGAGLDILRLIKTNQEVNRPGHIVGLTAYADAFEAASAEFKPIIWKLVEFSHTKTDWEVALKEALAFLTSERTIPPNDGRTYRSDVGIVTAVEEEFNAIKQWDADWKEFKIKHDPLRYIEGQISRDQKNVNVIAVQAPRMGLPAAAVTASNLIAVCRPRYLVMVGICAGVRDKTKLGDILIADPCFDWGSGKWVQSKENGELRFRPAPYQWRMSQTLRSKFEKLKADSTFLRNLYNNYEKFKPGLAPEVYIDAMASGGSVLQASKLVAEVIDQHKNLVGVEMENYSVFSAAEYAPEPQPKCFAVKSVCDFGDENKDDRIHEYAAYLSAEFVKEFVLREISSGPIPD